jgi:hypothetical protein
MKPRKKNKLFNFLCAFLPGASEMYMGFMKNGVSLMLMFFVSLSPLMFFNALEPLASLSVVIWFYGFFHARNLAGMSEEEFAQAEDRYIWEEFGDFKGLKVSSSTARKWIAAILILIGCSQLWNYFTDTIYRLIPDSYWDYVYPVVRDIPEVIVAVLFIVIGVRLIAGKKKELESAPIIEVKQIPDMSRQDDCPASKEA